jgi:hypothetical protein
MTVAGDGKTMTITNNELLSGRVFRYTARKQ